VERPIKRIAVIGMGRSGTSFLAQFLAKSGVLFEAPGKKLSKHEHPAAREINEAILAGYGAKNGRPYGRLPAEEIPVDDRWRPKAAEFIEHMDRIAAGNGGADYWAFKDPRTTVVHSLWLDDFDIVAAIFRHPADVVSSYLAPGWIKKGGIALDYWIRFNRSLLTVNQRYASEKPVYILDFNDDIPEQLATLCERLGLPQNDEAFSLYSKPDSRERPTGLKHEAEAQRIYEELRQVRNLL